MADEHRYPELDRLVDELRDDALAEAARLLMLLSRLDQDLPPGQPMRQTCTCCAGDGGYRMREHVCRRDSSTVRRHCRYCDEPGTATVPDLFPDHPGEACHGCAGLEDAA